MGFIEFQPANCKNCYKCIRYCAVKAISFQNEQARVIDNECILCGRCTMVCPQNAKQIKSDLETVQTAVQNHQKLIASLAPSYAAAFQGVSFAVLSNALKRLGFAQVEETAIGATEVSRQYEQLMQEGKMENILSTCCPSIIALVEKHYPELTQYLAPVASPSTVHARMIHAIYGNRAKVVFIGPCFAKKLETGKRGDLFAVLTLAELQQWMKEAGIELLESDEKAAEIQQTKSRLYPVPGGIVSTLDVRARKRYRCLSVDGLDRCMQTLEAMRTHRMKGYFIEMSACTGSCLGGPGMEGLGSPLVLAREEVVERARKRMEGPAPLTENAKVDALAEYHAKPIKRKQPTEAQIQLILEKLGKRKEQDCLNCGTCGYSTCREKAIAVFQGKADLFMCLPYMREKAESMSNLILEHTPNGIVLLNDKGCILEANAAAKALFLDMADELKGAHIESLLNEVPYKQVQQSGRPLLEQTTATEDQKHIVEQSVVPLPNGDCLLLLKDITEEERKRHELELLRGETVETAQRVIEKQMRVAQEIASLLGETTGETKMALTKLKQSILREPRQ